MNIPSTDSANMELAFEILRKDWKNVFIPDSESHPVGAIYQLQFKMQWKKRF